VILVAAHVLEAEVLIETLGAGIIGVDG